MTSVQSDSTPPLALRDEPARLVPPTQTNRYVFVGVLTLLLMLGVSLQASRDISGLLVTRKGASTICVEERHHEHRQRFTIAHEIGHLEVHPKTSYMGLCTDEDLLPSYNDGGHEQAQCPREFEVHRILALGIEVVARERHYLRDDVGIDRAPHSECRNQQGIAASSGSACTSGSLEPSHVLRAMAIPYTAAHGTIRFSLSRYNTVEEVDRVVAAVPPVIAKLRKLSPYWSGDAPLAHPDEAFFQPEYA